MKANYALLIIDHGSVVPAANAMLEDVAEIIQKIHPELIVKIAHMELAKPTISDGIKDCILAGATEITAHPYMLSPGRHSTKDIPRLVRLAAEEYPGVKFIVTEPLGVHEKICQVVLERARIKNPAASSEE